MLKNREKRSIMRRPIVIVGIVFVLLLAAGVVLFLKPPAVPVEGVPNGFAENQYDTAEVILNYVEGPDTGQHRERQREQCTERQSETTLTPELRTVSTYDAPLLSFPTRAGFKFLSEYDVDFSTATYDGRLSSGFDPVEVLQKVECPVLYLHATWSRHETWGLLGAADAEDIRKVQSHVGDLSVVPVESRHEVHMRKPDMYLDHVMRFLDTLDTDKSS